MFIQLPKESKLDCSAKDDTSQPMKKTSFKEFYFVNLKHHGSLPSGANTLDVQKILEERGAKYGTFYDLSRVSQRLKHCVITELEFRKKSLNHDQMEALTMICHKMARIINGDPDYADSWQDIAGYAQLVADRLNGVKR